MLKEILEAIAGEKNSVDLTTSKSPVSSITVIKYKSGNYGILNYSMGGEARQFVMDNGFKIDRNTLYPHKNFQSLNDVEKELSKLFGIRKGLVELEFVKSLKNR